MTEEKNDPWTIFDLNKENTTFQLDRDNTYAATSQANIPVTGMSNTFNTPMITIFGFFFPILSFTVVCHTLIPHRR